MARLFQDGFEYNNTVANFPWNINGGGAATYVTTTTRNGTYAGQINSLVSATRAGWLMQFAAATGTGPYFVRFYINITTLPSASNTIFAFSNGTTLAATESLCLKLNSDGTLGLYNLITQIGANSATVLSTGRWYMIEVKFSSVGGAAASIGEVRIDGTVAITSSTQTYAINTESFMIGGNLKAELQTTGKWFFDDVAVNDSTGASQTGYPGHGNIVRLKPNAAGDNNQFTTPVGGTAGATNNYTRANAVDLSQATVYNGDKTNGHIDDFNMDNTPSSINSYSTISVVTVDLAAFDDGAPSIGSAIQPRIKKAAAGTVSSGTAFTAPTSGSVVVNKASVPWISTLVLYNDPDGIAWTKTTLDSMQAGYKCTTTTSFLVDATNLSVQVDFVNNYTESSTISSATTPSSTETPAHTDSNTVASKTTPVVTLETKQSVESATCSTVTSLTRTEIKQSVDSSTCSNRTTPSSSDTKQSVDSTAVSTITSLTKTETKQSVDSVVCSNITSLTSTETKQSVDSRTVSSATSLTSSDVKQSVDSITVGCVASLTSSEIATYLDSRTINSITWLSRTEITRLVDSSTVSLTTRLTSVDVFTANDVTTVTGITSLSSVDTAQYVDSGTIATIGSHTSLDNVFGLDRNTCSSSTTLSPADTAQLVNAATCSSTTRPINQIDYTNFVESRTIPSKTVVSSTEFGIGTDEAKFTTKTIISTLADVAVFVDSNTLSTTTTPITIIELKSASELNTITATTGLIYTEVFNHPFFPITSVTTIVQIAEVQFIVELVAVAYKRYTTALLDTNHYSATSTMHFTCDSDNHYEAQGVNSTSVTS